MFPHTTRTSSKSFPSTCSTLSEVSNKLSKLELEQNTNPVQDKNTNPVQDKNTNPVQDKNTKPAPPMLQRCLSGLNQNV
jgi:hypothetical protein